MGQFVRHQIFLYALIVVFFAMTIRHQLFAESDAPRAAPDKTMNRAVEAMISAIELEDKERAKQINQSIAGAFKKARGVNPIITFFKTDAWEIWWDAHGNGLKELLYKGGSVLRHIVYITTFDRSDDGIGAITIDRLAIKIPAHLFGVQYEDDTMLLALCDDEQCVFRDLFASERQPVIKQHGEITHMIDAIVRGTSIDDSNK